MAYPVFASGDVLNASDMNAVGLWKIATSTISANSFEFNGCFSSSYDVYVINVSYNGSNSSSGQMRVKSGTSTVESGAVYDRYGAYWNAGAWSSFDLANQTSMFVNNMGSSSTVRTMGQIIIHNPNKAEETLVQMQVSDSTGLFVLLNYRIQTTTQYTGFQIYNNTGGQTLTGTATVYGYKS